MTGAGGPPPSQLPGSAVADGASARATAPAASTSAPRLMEVGTLDDRVAVVDYRSVCARAAGDRLHDLLPRSAHRRGRSRPARAASAARRAAAPASPLDAGGRRRVAARPRGRRRGLRRRRRRPVLVRRAAARFDRAGGRGARRVRDRARARGARARHARARDLPGQPGALRRRRRPPHPGRRDPPRRGRPPHVRLGRRSRSSRPATTGTT